ncbi:MAG TPA: crosslink repair DNA glycosylase YcaQ family protein, partial [Thermomicrobiales bacterium]|nr:crosslink repair DNA glycosylase YcaQ family protein [Thermomicrobiales bacterium]
MSTQRAANGETAQLTWDQALAWRLARHHLVARAAPNDLVRVVGELAGVHAQVKSSAELSLWARIDDLDRSAVERALWTDRALVKLWAMRGTLHLLPAAELDL